MFGFIKLCFGEGLSWIGWMSLVDAALFITSSVDSGPL